MIGTLAIRQAVARADIARVGELFQEHATWLKADLGFQDFEHESLSLPGAYAPPSGRLLLADADGQAAGCVALSRLDSANCEIKRLWVRPPMRHCGVGRLLLKRVIEAAGDIGYKRVLLDMLPPMTAAASLFRSFGFTEIPAHDENPVPGARHLSLELS